MIKRAASLILSASIMVGTIPVFAESNLNDDQNNAIISTEEFTDKNVIYSALQDMNDGVSLFSDAPEEITADFDVVLGFDMSSNMYGFDYNGEMAWKDDFTALQEQAPAGTRFSVVTGETGEFGIDLSSMIGTLPVTYSGSTDILTLLENCADTFDDESDDRNKVVIATTAEISDSAALANEMDELRSEGIVPFVFVLDAGNNNTIDDIDGIYRCMSSLELRLAVSDLYLSFAEFDSAAENIVVNDDEYSVMPLNNGDSTPNDYKPDKHKITGYDSNVGKALISVLNIYGAVPMYISSTDMESTGYNMLDGSISNNDIANFKEANNVELSSDLVNKMSPVWENIFQQIKDDSNDFVTDVDTALENNIKRRFPVIAFDENATSIEILTGSAVSEGYTYALDTYEYLMAMVTRAEAAVTEDTSVDRAEKIILNYPIAADASYKLYGYEASTGNASPPEDTFSKSNSSCELNMMLPSNITSINYAIAVETKYDNGMPDMIYTNRFYISRGYTDLIQGTWYRDFVLDATNKGFVQGMGDGTFSPESTLTRGQFLVMLLNAADINLNEYDTIDFTDKDNSSELSSAQSNMPEWVRRYMNYAWDNKLINTVQYIGSAEEDGEFTEGYAQELNRAEAAYILYMMFIGNLENIRVPSNIYFYDESISNYKTELWNAHMAFAEQQDENSELNNLNHVEQMYYNGVLEGMPGNADEGDDPNKIYFYPNKTLTRAEACKVVLKCLFELNDDIPEIQANIFEDDVEAVPLPDGDHIKDRYVLDSIPFDATNQILYEFHVDDNKEYAIETTGEVDNTTTWGRLYYVDGNSTINNITLDGSNHMLIVFHGAGDYRLRIKRTGKNDTIGLRISEVGVSDLSAVKREGGNSIFVNSPEYISHVHTLSADTPEYIFSQDNVSGYNVMYATHYLPETDGVFNAKQDLDYENYDNAYYDIEFYNPTNNPVTIKLNSIGYDSTTYGYGWYPMMAISNYYNLPITMESYILGNSAYKEWIPQEPKDILKNLDLDANGNETNEFTVQPGEHYFLLSNNVSWGDALIIPTQRSGGNFIYLYTDFEVLDGKEITVRTAVDYEQNLFMMNCQKENISMGDYKYYDNEIERDIASKVKGIDWGHLPIVDYNMEYIITENTIGENLKQNVIDDAFYQGSELKNNPVDGWSTHINPYFDVNAANDLLMPSGLMEYEYSDSQGLWSFGYDRIIGLGIREDDETGIYKNRQIINDKHPLSQNGKTAYNEIMENLINGTDNYPWRGGTVPTTDPETQINLPQPVIDDAKNGYLYAQSLGEWGVDQYYTVTFRNTYDYDIKIRFCMKSNSPAMIRYNIDGSWQTKLNLGKESEFNTIFEVTIPGKSTKDCEFSYITSAGPGCAEHYFEVGE